eukprot:6446709-Alexandrium_andersonii.AAC.1
MQNRWAIRHTPRNEPQDVRIGRTWSVLAASLVIVALLSGKSSTWWEATKAALSDATTPALATREPGAHAERDWHHRAPDLAGPLQSVTKWRTPGQWTSRS